MWFSHGFLGVAACTHPPDLSPLSDVPIDGGTVEQREAVRAELVDIERWIGPDRLRLRVVTFETLEPPFGGKYVGDGVVLLSDHLGGTFQVRTVTRHEVCHALDRAEGLSAEPFDAWAQIGADLEQSEAFRDLSELGWRAEAFAQTCEIAPFVTHLLSTTCPDDDPRISEIAAWLLRRVWTGSEAPVEAPLATPVVFQPPTTGSSISGRPWVDGTVSATTDEALVEVGLIDDEGFGDTWIVDRETGQIVTDRAVEVVDPIQRIDPPITHPLSGTIVPYGYEASVAVGYLRADVSELGAADGRMLWLDAAGSWSPVRDGCWDSAYGFPRDVFIAEDRVWTAWYDGERFTWAPIAEP